MIMNTSTKKQIKHLGGGWKCCVLQCNNNTSTSKLAFHRFPKNVELAKKWLIALGKADNERNLRLFRRKRICSLHFTKEDEQKSSKRIPKLFLCDPELSISRSLAPPELSSPSEEILYFFDVTDVDVTEVTTESYIEDKVAHPIIIKHKPFTISEQEHRDHTYHFDGNINIVKNLQAANHQLDLENTKLKYCLLDEVLLRPFLLNFYTGFDNPKLFSSFLTILKSQAELFNKHCIKKARAHKLSKDHELLIFFSRLRLGLLENDLAFQHKVSQSVVSRSFNFWLNVIYTYLIQIPMWPSKSLVKKYMPEAFERVYPSTRVILDATEIKIQKPSDYICQSKTYSSYKSTNTAKGVIGISPNGFVSFVSPLYPGRISDEAMYIKSKLNDKLEPGDSVMADRGFTIQNELRRVNCDLNIPPFALKSCQLDHLQEQVTRDIASLRIHFERKIREVKVFNLLKTAIPINSIDQLNKIWTVCSLLPNIAKPPLLSRM